jgi:hypothetical protein
MKSFIALTIMGVMADIWLFCNDEKMLGWFLAFILFWTFGIALIALFFKGAK